MRYFPRLRGQMDIRSVQLMVARVGLEEMGYLKDRRLNQSFLKNLSGALELFLAGETER